MNVNRIILLLLLLICANSIAQEKKSYFLLEKSHSEYVYYIDGILNGYNTPQI